MRLLRVILLPLACAISQAQDAGLVIGSIGDIEMRKDEILESLGGLGTVEKEALARDPAALNKLLRSMLVQRVIYQQAVEVKWDQEPAIQPLLKSTREAAITDSYLKHISRPPEGYPDETELRKAYEASRAELTVPRSFRLAQIFITAGSDQQLAEVKKRLKADPAGFGRIAREMSEEKESAAREGEIGWLTERQVQPEIFEQLPKLSLNVVSEPVRLKDGWHILKVLDVREPFTPIFDQVRVQLAQRLRAEKIRVGMQAYVAETLQKHPVAINEVALSKLLQEVPTRDSALKP
jgi:peptidylprolyl isomerase